MNAISIEHLQKEYTDFELNIASLQVKEGYVTGFIGENGSGKSTTLKSLVGLIKPSAGEITILGTPINKLTNEIKREIGFLGEYTGFFELAKLKAIKEMVAPFYDSWDETKYRELLKRFNLSENKKWKDLSQGKKKLFALTILLAKNQKLIIMDEPTANLDPFMRQTLLEILAEQMETEGTTIFFSTHITSDLDKIADYVCFLHKGQILLQDEKDTIISSHRIIKGPLSLLSLKNETAFIGIRKSDFNFSALTNNIEQINEWFGNEVIYETPTLEDIFIYYTKEAKTHD